MVAAVGLKGKGEIYERRSSNSLGYFGTGTSTSSRSFGVEAGHRNEMTVRSTLEDWTIGSTQITYLRRVSSYLLLRDHLGLDKDHVRDGQRPKRPR